ncbi:MAG: 3'-5' exonuclease [Eubacteriales bacterium]|nr:3'-5' exonuclease [Eubacteriales bacterium]
MNKIVFDLEWNQSPKGKEYSNKHLPFEIIEIGAVKLNNENEIVDRFQCLIRPKVYTWIHSNIHEVIHLNYRELKKGLPFEQAANEFFEWCGPEHQFYVWGDQDIKELQRNLKFYGMLDLMPGPIVYYDVQKLYTIQCEGKKAMRALESAVETFRIPHEMEFHRALADAYYTALVLQKLKPELVSTMTSIDVYQNPKSKREEIHLSYPKYDKYISREFLTKEKALRDREVCSTKCPKCKKPAKRTIRWFMNNGKTGYSVSVCTEHGLVKGKNRVRKTEEGKYYIVKTLKLINETEAGEIREKREHVRMKRKQNRQKINKDK